MGRLFTWDDEHRPVPEQMTTPARNAADFTTKTHRELARLSNEAQQVRRYVAHPACGDKGACVHCAKIVRLHAQMDDHLDQLEAAGLEAALGGMA